MRSKLTGSLFQSLKNPIQSVSNNHYSLYNHPIRLNRRSKSFFIRPNGDFSKAKEAHFFQFLKNPIQSLTNDYYSLYNRRFCLNRRSRSFFVLSKGTFSKAKEAHFFQSLKKPIQLIKSDNYYAFKHPIRFNQQSRSFFVRSNGDFSKAKEANFFHNRKTPIQSIVKDRYYGFHRHLRSISKAKEAHFFQFLKNPIQSVVKVRYYGFHRHLRLFSKVKEAHSATVSSSFDSAGNAKSGFVGWYLRMLGSRPVLTKSFTAGVVFLVADLSAQTITAPSESFDLVRASRMASYGILISGPSLHLWFNFLSRVLPKRDLVNTLKKMVLGQTTYGPFICSLFFSLNAFLQGETGSEILQRLKRDLPPTILNGLFYWPICDFITFRFVPVHLQPLVSNSFSFVWTIYLTYTASLDKPADPAAL